MTDLVSASPDYRGIFGDIVALLKSACLAAARSVNALCIDDSWFRVDLLFFHRRLKRFVLIDLKVGKFSYADAGQVHPYLNYAREHWTKPGENPPVGLIRCAEKGASEAEYTVEGMPNKVLAAEYQTVLPDEKLPAEELAKTRLMLEARHFGQAGDMGGGE